MNPKLRNLFRLDESQIISTSIVLGRTFKDNPLSIYRIPDDSDRVQKLKFLFEFTIRYGVLFGEVYSTSPNLEGIAGWIPFEKVYQSTEDQIRSGGKKIVNEFGMEFIKKQYSLQKFLDILHNRNAPFPHLYLYPLGVDPRFQGKGYGSLLLKAMFEKVDQTGMPIYLETDKEKNVSFYQKHEFKVMEKISIPNTDIPVWAMLRKI